VSGGSWFVCQQCGIQFTRETIRGRPPLFCSVVCRQRADLDRKNGRNAGEHFYYCRVCHQVIVSTVRKSGARYCSPECEWKVCQCALCGENYRQRRGDRNPTAFCSKECRYNSRYLTKSRKAASLRPVYYCKHCGKQIENAGRPDKISYCSRECYHMHRSGKMPKPLGYDPKRSRHDADTRRREREGTKGTPVYIRRMVAERDNWVCQLCGLPVDASLRFPNRMSATVDHVVPLAKGGSKDIANLQCAHLGCNSRKKDRISEEQASYQVTGG
jgi:hypothetical protein